MQFTDPDGRQTFRLAYQPPGPSNQPARNFPWGRWVEDRTLSFDPWPKPGMERILGGFDVMIENSKDTNLLLAMTFGIIELTTGANFKKDAMNYVETQYDSVYTSIYKAVNSGQFPSTLSPETKLNRIEALKNQINTDLQFRDDNTFNDYDGSGNQKDWYLYHS